MSQYRATVSWVRNNDVFLDGKYSRNHTWRIESGTVFAASSSPSIVPEPYSDTKAIDPEEALIASVSSCHMLWFLDFARQAGFVVDTYMDAATGTMSKAIEGERWISRIDLFPRMTCFGPVPKAHFLKLLHNNAHKHCFIANSLKSEIVIHIQ